MESKKFFSLFVRRRARTSLRPSIDRHTLFTNCQMSRLLLQGVLQVNEPWRSPKKKPKTVHACLYTNDSNPFLVWYQDGRRKRPRGLLYLRRCRMLPVEVRTLHVVVDASPANLYKFHADGWERREEWLYQLREQSRKDVTVVVPLPPEGSEDGSSPTGSLATPPPLEEGAGDPRRRRCERAASWRHGGRTPGHRRTASADSATAALDLAMCNMQLQRSRSQPHLQKGKLVKRRPHLIEKKQQLPPLLVNHGFVRKPDL